MMISFLLLGRFLGDRRGAGSVGTGFVQSQALFGERGGHLTERVSGELAYVVFLLCDFIPDFLPHRPGCQGAELQ